MDDKLSISIFDKIKDRFLQLSKEATFIKECSFAIQHLNKNSYLRGATQESILESVLNVAQLGLTLNPVSKIAYLVPRYIGGKLICSLDISYQGYVKLATDTGSVKNIYSHIVYEGDLFEQSLGTSPEIIHKPKLGQRNKPIAVYAIAILSDGRKQIEVMDISEVNDIREISESYKAFKSGKAKSCIWDDYYDEMARKTVIKRICKYLPKTEMWDKLYKAIDIDNEDYKISNEQINYIESIIDTASYSQEKKEFILRYINTYNADQASKLIEDLKINQINRISAGSNYGAGDIKKKLDTLS